jgi:hypothetical protein
VGEGRGRDRMGTRGGGRQGTDRDRWRSGSRDEYEDSEDDRRMVRTPGRSSNRQENGTRNDEIEDRGTGRSSNRQENVTRNDDIEDRGNRSVVVEREDMIVDAEGDNGGGNKRKIDDRSPGQETGRVNRMRMDEFEVGIKFTEISETMQKQMDKILKGLEQIKEGDTEGMKKAVKAGFKVMTTAVEGTMNGIGDAVATERKEREIHVKETEARINKIEESAKEAMNKAEGVRRMRETERKKESRRDMEDKMRQSNKQIKYINIGLGKESNSRREIVERLIEYVKEDVKLADRKRLDFLLKRTRVIVLGKGTSRVKIGDKAINTVPILLECRTEDDRIELEFILRGGGYYGSYHWPLEAMDFARGVRNEVKKMGYSEERNYIRIRPEEREGRMQLRADVKDKQGGRFGLVATWDIPPMDKTLWELDVFRPKWVKNLERR